jgi:hypothetical protein
MIKYRFIQHSRKSRSKADVLAFQKEYHKSAPKYAQAVIDSEPLTTYGKAQNF